MIVDENMKVILQDWANRGRLHRGPVVLNQLYQRLKRVYSFAADRATFEKCLLTLESQGHGYINRGNKGALISFSPKGDIVSVAKSLGFESKVARRAIQPATATDIPAREEVTKETRVVVLFTVRGLRCRADIPERAIDEFEKLIKT